MRLAGNLITVCLTVAALFAAPARPLAREVSRPTVPALYVAQAAGTTAADASLRLRVGYPATLGSGRSLVRSIDAAEREPASLGFTGIQAVALGSAPLDAAAIQARAAARLALEWPSLQSRLAALMRTVGAGAAFYSFVQRVVVAGDARAFYLTFTAALDGGGRATASGVRLRAATPVFVHAIYTPLHASSELPKKWAYEGAGTLRWRLVDGRLNPIGRDAVVQTGGAFDEPEAVVAGDQVAPQRGLDCLVDRRARGCDPAAAIDLRALIASTGADGALVDYRWPMKPHCVERGDAPAACERDVRFVAVTRRTLSYGAACRTPVARYRNAGAASETLEAAADRYWVDARDGNPRWIGSRRDLVATGVELYDRQVDLPPAQAASIAATMIVNPLGEVPPLVAIDDGAPALRRLAPLQTDVAAGTAPCR